MGKVIGRSVLLLALAAMVVFGAAAFLTSVPPAEAAGGGPGGQPCGGFAGLECPNPKQICVDDPRDDCDPKKGGADCIGICRGPAGGGTSSLFLD